MSHSHDVLQRAETTVIAQMPKALTRIQEDLDDAGIYVDVKGFESELVQRLRDLYSKDTGDGVADLLLVGRDPDAKIPLSLGKRVCLEGLVEIFESLVRLFQTQKKSRRGTPSCLGAACVWLW